MALGKLVNILRFTVKEIDPSTGAAPRRRPPAPPLLDRGDSCSQACRLDTFCSCLVCESWHWAGNTRMQAPRTGISSHRHRASRGCRLHVSTGAGTLQSAWHGQCSIKRSRRQRGLAPRAAGRGRASRRARRRDGGGRLRGRVHAGGPGRGARRLHPRRACAQFPRVLGGPGRGRRAGRRLRPRRAREPAGAAPGAVPGVPRRARAPRARRELEACAQARAGARARAACWEMQPASPRCERCLNDLCPARPSCAAPTMTRGGNEGAAQGQRVAW